MITSPLNLNNCEIWLDASDLSYLFANKDATDPVLLNGDPVGYWGDKSGKNYNFTNVYGTEANRPKYISNSFNSLPSIRFDGASSYLTLNTSFSTLSSEYTAFIVAAKHNLTPIVGRVLTQTRQPSSTDLQRGYCALVTQSNSLNTASLVDNGTFATTSWRSLSTFDIFTQRISASPIDNATGFTGNIRNGKLVQGGTVTGSFTHRISSSLMRLGTNITNSLSGWAGNLYFDGDVSEVIIYSRYLSQLERHQIEYYLAKKWNIDDAKVMYALSAGNWSDYNIWAASAIPVVGSEVYTNGQQVTLNQNNIDVRRLGNQTLSPNVVNGFGNFIVNSAINITSRSGFFGTANGSTCLVSNVTTGTLTLSGSIFHSRSVYCAESCNIKIYGTVYNQGDLAESITLAKPNAYVTLYGNVSAGNNGNSGGNGYGIRFFNIGYLDVYGNVHGGSRSLYTDVTNGASKVNCDGVYIKDGIVNVYGDVYGSDYWTSTSWFSRAISTDNAIVNIYGNVYGGGYNQKVTTIVSASCPTIEIGSLAKLNVYGNVYASDYNNAIVNNLYYSNEINIYGSIINGNNGVQAIYSNQYYLKPKPYNSFTKTPNTKLINLLSYTEDWKNPGLSIFRVSLSANTNPQDTITTGISSFRIIANTSTSTTHGVTRNTFFNSGSEQIYSAYFKASGVRYVSLYFSSGDRQQVAETAFDLQDGICVARYNLNSAWVTMTAVDAFGDGWYRCYMGAVVPNSGSFKLAEIYLLSQPNVSTGKNFIGNNIDGIIVGAPQLHIAQINNDRKLPYVSSANVWGYKNIGNSPFEFFLPDSYGLSYIPAPSSVRQNVYYAAISALSGINVSIFESLTGTMIVPSKDCVSYGINVDNTQGRAIISKQVLQSIWNTDVSNLTSNKESLFSRMANSVTTGEAGYTLEELQTL
jgi:hypothetical protein